MSSASDATRLAVTLLTVGASLIVWGVWIPAKAWLAQRLIERAWTQTQDEHQRGKPWPWADTWPVAKLVPHDPLMGPLFVLAGASGQSMAFGPGHVASSAAPGEDDNIVLAGHRDTHFSFLKGVKAGDVLTLESRDSATRYAVESIEVVHESRVDLIERTGEAELTLVTCFPFDAIAPGGPLRFIVHARAIANQI